MLGEHLEDRWVLGKEVGSGGFAKVFEACPKLSDSAEEAAVIKLIPKMPGAARELLFEDLPSTPNIIPVLDRGEWSDNWALVMPQAEKSLRDYLNKRNGKLPLAEAVSVLISVAEALVALEGRIVHRDLKPDNILLWDGRWCLADFGVARYCGATTAPDTRKYALTPQYAAPEQWTSERATSATDVYAVGIIAFELLTGRTPFPGPRLEDYREQHLEDIPPLISEILPSLDQLIAECLYKSPQARPTPQNILTRLRGTQTPLSDAAHKLQQAYGKQVVRRAEQEREALLTRTDADRKVQLFAAGSLGLAQLVARLRTEIEVAAPGSSGGASLPWLCTLGTANLRIDEVRQAKTSSEGRYSSPFEVIAYSRILLQIPPDPWGYEGRSHSLWYCDVRDQGVFRWYETAFMITPLIPKRGRMDPFALNPEQDAFGALSPVMTEYKVAWPFTPIDQGEEAEFVERWMGWLAAAAEGQLRHPTSMPERDPRGSWRANSGSR
jgi:eukaryotic-like serine/threonine-protein kinase